MSELVQAQDRPEGAVNRVSKRREAPQEAASAEVDREMAHQLQRRGERDEAEPRPGDKGDGDGDQSGMHGRVRTDRAQWRPHRFRAQHARRGERGEVSQKVADQQVEKNKSAQHAALEEYKILKGLNREYADRLFNLIYK